jgi:hypothetical protein
MILKQKMMTNAMFIVVFYSSYETRVEDNNKRASSLSSTIQERNIETQKRMTSFPTHH